MNALTQRRVFWTWSVLLSAALLVVLACGLVERQPPAGAAQETARPLPTREVAPPTAEPARSTDTPQAPATSVPATASATPEATPPPNVILVIVDALRADHVGAYGYGRPTTPNLDATLAQAGVRFADVTSNSSWTYPANAAMLTGRTPSDLGVVWHDKQGRVPEGETLLAEYLHEAGYYTAGFNTAKFVAAQYGFAQGFDYYEDRVRDAGQRARADEVNAMAVDWLENTWTPTISGTQPLFLYLYYFDPHTWFDPPPPYDTLYDPDYTGDLTAEVYQDGVDVASGQIVPTARDVEHLIALYDGEITYWDHHFGEMMAYLEEIGLLENTLVLLTSDHGQMFGEHGKWTHRNSLYEEVLRVPLLARYDGVLPAGRVVTAPVLSFDLMPAVLEWAGVPVPGDLRAVSLRPLAEGTAGPEAAARAVFSEMDVDKLWDADPMAPAHPLRAVRREGWKYITHLGAQEQDALYRVAPASLYERENLLHAEPARADELYWTLIEWFYSFQGSSSLRLDKSAAPRAGVRAGDPLTYTLTLSGPAVAARLRDPLPEGVDFISGTLRGTLDAVYSPALHSIAWAGTLEDGAPGMVQFQVTPNLTDGGSLMLAPPLVNTAWLIESAAPRGVRASAIVNGGALYVPVLALER